MQTLLRIFDTYGDQLSPAAWQSCLRIVVCKMMEANRMELERLPDSGDGEETVAWNGTSIMIVAGVAGFFSEYLDTFVQQEDFAGSWQMLIGYYEGLARRKCQEINAAIFASLQRVLEKIDVVAKVGQPAVDLVWSLWSQDMPVRRRAAGPHSTSHASGNNQDALVKYVACFREVYRLSQGQFGETQVILALDLLHACIVESDKPAYASDVDSPTLFQGQVLDVLSVIRTDTPRVPSALVAQASRLMRLPFELDESNDRGLSFIALSKASMDLVRKLVLGHLQDVHLYSSGAFRSALNALALPITIKYLFQRAVKGTALWQAATSTSLAMLERALPAMGGLSIDERDLQRIWKCIVVIANGIVSAPVEATDRARIAASDEDFDVKAFLQIRALLTPALGASDIPDRTRRVYTEGLFRNSIIHQPGAGEIPESGREILEGLYKGRVGRTCDAPAGRRSRMSYTCLDELFRLVQREDGSAERIRLAQAASPFLILRVGMTLRAYIAVSAQRPFRRTN